MPKKQIINKLFVNFTKEYWDYLLKYAMILAKNRIEADDLVQNTLLKGLNAFSNFLIEYLHINILDINIILTKEQKLYVKNWLFKIMKNTWLDYISLSRFKHEKFNVPDYEMEHNVNNFTNEEYLCTNNDFINVLDGEDNFFKLAADDDLFKKINELSPKHRSILFLIAEDYSYKEIAELLDIPIGTVMSSLSRIIIKMKK